MSDTRTAALRATPGSSSNRVRGTQSLVNQMSWVFARPSLTLLEVAWRWLIGVPFLAVCWLQAQHILADLPLESSGASAVNFQNPWVGVVQLASAWALYKPHVLAVLPWIAAPAALAWAVISGIGRNLVFMRMEPGTRFRPVAMIVLQAVWLAALLALWWGWFASIGWVAQTHITASAEPDLVGYSIWTIFLSLGFFTLWALVSWPLAVAPVLALLEQRSALSSLGRAFSPGKTFTGKLVETNLVMGIVKLMLIVLAMVFSSVLLPFADEVGASALHLEWVVIAIFYFIANDYFHVLRLKGYVEFWRTWRGRERSTV